MKNFPPYQDSVILMAEEHKRVNEIKICRHKSKQCLGTYIKTRKHQRMCVMCLRDKLQNYPLLNKKTKKC